jgi:alpha-tubulin suppressor-like RCC1 family protein
MGTLGQSKNGGQFLANHGGFFSCPWRVQFGQLGLGHNEDANAPEVVATLAGKKITLVSCGWCHTLAVTDNAEVFSWGHGRFGQLGHSELADL